MEQSQKSIIEDFLHFHLNGRTAYSQFRLRDVVTILLHGVENPLRYLKIFYSSASRLIWNFKSLKAYLEF